MSKKRKDEKRVSRSLKAPFNLDQLREFVDSLPKKASVRLVTVSRHGSLDMSPGSADDAAYLEALWWEKR